MYYYCGTNVRIMVGDKVRIWESGVYLITQQGSVGVVAETDFCEENQVRVQFSMFGDENTGEVRDIGEGYVDTFDIFVKSLQRISDESATEEAIEQVVDEVADDIVQIKKEEIQVYSVVKYRGVEWVVLEVGTANLDIGLVKAVKIANKRDGDIKIVAMKHLDTNNAGERAYGI
jgi:hypothetical protein